MIYDDENLLDLRNMADDSTQLCASPTAKTFSDGVSAG